jgi:hypothetical protein
VRGGLRMTPTCNGRAKAWLRRGVTAIVTRLHGSLQLTSGCRVIFIFGWLQIVLTNVM